MAAQPQAAPAWDRTPTPGTSVDVEMELYVKSIQEISARLGTARVLIGINLHWTDPRVAKERARDPRWRPPEKMWVPSLQFANGIGAADALIHSKPGNFVEMLDRANPGHLKATYNFSGEVDNPMALDGFPFDEDSLDFRFCGARMASGERVDGRDFTLRAKGGDKFINFNFDSHLPEFQILGASFVQYRQWGFSYITAGITLRRKHQYYFFKVTLLMWLIVLLAMPTFLYGFDQLEQRMSLVSTMFLATAATLYVVGQDLPKTNDLNKMDKLLLGTLAIIFGAGAESIAVHQMHVDDPDGAEELESAVTIALPVLYVVLNTALFLAPVLRVWSRGAKPAKMRKERTYIAWKDVTKVDPWGVDTDKAEVLVVTSSNPTDDAAERGAASLLSKAPPGQKRVV